MKKRHLESSQKKWGKLGEDWAFLTVYNANKASFQIL